MKKTILLSTLFIGFLLLAACSGSGKKEETSNNASADSGKYSYTCPMDTEVVSANPGNCPKCGMELEKVALAEVK